MLDRAPSVIGVAVYYKDDFGRWLKEYPDGRRTQVVEFKGRDREKEIPLD